MAAPLYVPFNHNPSATGASNSGYTVPAGKYAWVSIAVRDGGSATLNGTAMLACDSAITDTQDGNKIDVQSSTTSSSTLYTVPSGKYFQGQIFLSQATSGTARITSAGTTVAEVAFGSNALSVPVTFAESADITISAIASGTATGAITGAEFDELTNDQDTRNTNSTGFYAKAGDVIAISGQGNLVYSEYDVPT